ncbi:MAG: GTPase ObgE [Spirochaetales bacterium]|nr:GTPase ObgE [Spirochaetales bacterium]
MFSDEAEIEVRSGNGGSGAVSFRREKYIPRGGPDGGDGGRGGDVIFTVTRNVKTLAHLKMRRRFFAKNGRPGMGRKMDGSRGEDTVITVPPGTVVYDDESGEKLLDLTDEGVSHVLFRGGRGGKGNTHFKSSTHQAPRFSQPGEDGVERRLRVELQIIADIGFVGLPNAGKSTLLKVLTAADPKIGNYPFTTVIPNLGVMHHYERDIVLADIPGIIEGAADGAGLGLQFLRHIARTKGLAFVIDAADADPSATYHTLRTELERYDAALLRKSHLVVVTKTDLVESGEAKREAVDAFRATLPEPIPVRNEPTDEGDAVSSGSGRLVAIVEVSAMSNRGLDSLRDALFSLGGVGER